eukprot:1413712-Alexandrium_andersonii.AAC.1
MRLLPVCSWHAWHAQSCLEHCAASIPPTDASLHLQVRPRLVKKGSKMGPTAEGTAPLHAGVC